MIIGTVLLCHGISCTPGVDGTGAENVKNQNTSPIHGVGKASVDNSEHDFGLIQPQGKVRHTFYLKNIGAGPLKILKVKKSCNCILDDLPLRILEPGESADIDVVIKLEGRQGPFEDTVTVRTDDPENKNVKLSLRGRAGWLLRSEPPQIAWEDINRHAVKRSSILIYSQVWDNYEVDRIEPSSKAIEYTIEPASSEQLRSVDAKSGYNVHVTLRAKQIDPTGCRFDESVQFQVCPSNDVDKQSMVLQVTGSFEKKMSLHGIGLTARHTLGIGTLMPGQGAHRRLILKVCDRQRQLNVEKIETYPEYLQVSLKSLSPENIENGIYSIEVDIPADAPEANYLQEDKAWFRIVTDHPALSEIRMPVEFAIVGT